MKAPDFSSLDPPGQPGEQIAWCPLCGEVVNRIPQGEWEGYAKYEESAREHMLMKHELTPEDAYAALMLATRR